jgi:DNA-directed RNA polymerase specialized sigma24 family protein
MDAQGSVSRWLDPLRAGDSAAVQHLWERYFHRLVGLARHKLQGAPRGPGDEEDVALSAFDSFCRLAGAGRFPELLDREGLWQLLVVITVRKASRLVRDEKRLKRGGAAVVEAETDAVLTQLLSREPTPEMAAQLAEEYRRLLARLADPELEAVAVARMEGYSVEEIAERLSCAARTVKRKLRLIRDIWEKEGEA